MPDIRFPCPACNSKLRITDPNLAGKRLRCPKCEEICRIPMPEEAPLEADQIVVEPPKSEAPAKKERKIATAPQKPPERAPRRDEEDAISSEPVRSKRKASFVEPEEDDFDDGPPAQKAPAPRSKVVAVIALVLVAMYAGGIAATKLGYLDLLDIVAPVEKKPNPPSGLSGLGDPGNRNGDRAIPTLKQGEVIELPPRDPEAERQWATEWQNKLAAIRQTESEVLKAMEANATAQEGARGGVIRLPGIKNAFELRQSFSPDGRFLAVGGRDSLKIWDLKTAQLRLALKDHKDLINVIRYSPTGEHLASGDYNGVVRIWNVEDGTLVREIKPFSSTTAQGLAFSPDGKLIAVSQRVAETERDQRPDLTVWQISDGKLIDSRYLGDSAKLTFHPGGKILAAAVPEKGARLLEVGTGNRYSLGFDGDVRNVTFSPDGSMIALVGNGESEEGVALLELGNPEKKPLPADLKKINHIVFFPEGKRIAFSAEGGVYFHAFENGNVGERLGQQSESRGQPRMEISPGGTYFAFERFDHPEVWATTDFFADPPKNCWTKLELSARSTTKGDISLTR